MVVKRILLLFIGLYKNLIVIVNSIIMFFFKYNTLIFSELCKITVIHIMYMVYILFIYCTSVHIYIERLYYIIITLHLHLLHF